VLGIGNRQRDHWIGALSALNRVRPLRALGSQGGAVRLARQGRRLGSGRCAFTRLPDRAGAPARL